jgi:Sugar-specific transcriptional regulator TrmB
MMLALKPDGAALRLECSKAKDSEPFRPWTLHLQATGDSCVLRLGSDRDQLSDQERQILETLPAAFGSEPAPASQLQKASGVPERSYYRALQSLQNRGFIAHQQVGRFKRYHLTEQARTALLPTTANHCQADDGLTAANATSLGVAVGSQPDSQQSSGWWA